jgi:hypothetical protein
MQAGVEIEGRLRGMAAENIDKPDITGYTVIPALNQGHRTFIFPAPASIHDLITPRPVR